MKLLYTVFSNNENTVRSPGRKWSSEASKLFTSFKVRLGIHCDMSYLSYIKCKKT